MFKGVPRRVIRRPAFLFILLGMLVSFTIPSGVTGQSTSTDTERSLLEINLDLKEKQQTIDELKVREKEYEDAIIQRQAEASSLEGQLGVIDNSIQRTETQLQIVQVRMEELTLEIELLEEHIAVKQREIDGQNALISDLIRELNRYDQKSLLEITVTNATFSDYYEQVRYTERLQRSTKDELDTLRSLKGELENQRADVQTARDEQEAAQKELEGEQLTLEGQRGFKETLLERTQASEEQYEDLVQQLRNEQLSIEGEIRSLQGRLDTLSQDQLDIFNDDIGALLWPIVPERGISAYFHDPTYPYRSIFEHDAIDIPALQGTPIRAAENGVVSRAVPDTGLGYNWIMIDHNESLSTIYGHVSAVYVSPGDIVLRGDIIGLSGGAPGTPGAGYLTTGAHLHFGVRVDGIPVDPLNYLP